MIRWILRCGDAVAGAEEWEGGGTEPRGTDGEAEGGREEVGVE